MEIHPYYHSWEKRIFDILTSSILLIIISPLLLVVGFVIFITTGSPIIYRQKRTGKNKKQFDIYKFRVMYVGAEKNQWRYRKNNHAPEPMYKNWDDPRFVGIGRWLSKMGLDELPQLINVIRGEMSLVGPRPLPVAESEKLKKQWDFRYKVKPGIFSNWSASFKGQITLKEWQQLEKETLKQGGLKYELDIIGKTLKGIVKNNRKLF